MSSENQQYCTPRWLSDFPAALKPFSVLAVVRRLNDTTAKFFFIPFCNCDANYHGICVTAVLKNSIVSRVKICLGVYRTLLREKVPISHTSVGLRGAFLLFHFLKFPCFMGKQIDPRRYCQYSFWSQLFFSEMCLRLRNHPVSSARQMIKGCCIERSSIIDPERMETHQGL